MADEIGDIKGVGSTTVDKLTRMGLEDIQELAKADPSLASEYPDVSMSEDRLEGIIEDAAANAIVIQSGDEVVDQYENITTRPSGISELDEKVGGFEARSLIAIGGSTGSGKTQLAFQALGEAVLDSGGKPAVYIETEPDRYRGGRIQQMFDKDVQSKVHKVSVGGEEALDMQYRSYKAVEEQFNDVSLVVVDSFTARFRLATKFDGRESLGKRNQEFSRHLQALEQMARSLDCPVLLICQVYANPTQYGSGDVIYGSSLMMHMVNYVMKMRSSGNAMTNITVQNHPEMSDFELSAQINDGGVDSARDV